MRKTFLGLMTVIISFLMVSCFQNNNEKDKGTTDVKDAATGNPGEIIVVMDDASWKNEQGKALKSVFHQDLYTVPEEEFIFDLYQIEKSEFTNINRRNRNVIIPEIGKGAEYGEIKIRENVFSEPQVIVYIKAPDIPTYVETVKSNEQKLINIFKIADRDRYLAYIDDYHVDAFRERLEEDHHVSLAVPKNYTIDENREDFAWVSYETRTASHGFLIFRFGENQREDASLDYFVRQINKNLKKNVPGERDSSYMTTETKYHYPIMSEKEINNTQTWIVEGLWKMEKDFMGGPFAAFIQYDEKLKEFVCIEAFIYDPKGGEHRDKIRKMKAIMHTMKIPE